MRTVTWEDGAVHMIDQTRLPRALVELELRDYGQVRDAIATMQVRGAPAIGVAGAYGLALAARQLASRDREGFLGQLEPIAEEMAATRPTAVNLRWAVERLMRLARRTAGEPADVGAALLAEAQAIEAEDEASCRALGRLGAALLPDDARVLTHCNAGGLATAGYGTALGVIRAAAEAGKRPSVYADETRPRLQGARLTAWELLQDHIPVTLIADTAAGHLMQQGRVDCVVVGADRIARNGDVANKIGTYQVAVLAHEHGIPFYVAAPLSTLDLSIETGAQIPIEERAIEEVTEIEGVRIAPDGVRAENPAFDVTPHRYVTAIITERGIAQPPLRESLAGLAQGAAA